jgi:hypothetical protein
MKKVGIITLTKNANYGNVLQNIAMQKIVNELGFEAETILNHCLIKKIFHLQIW